jgi:hypothetical protein
MTRGVGKFCLKSIAIIAYVAKKYASAAWIELVNPP